MAAPFSRELPCLSGSYRIPCESCSQWLPASGYWSQRAVSLVLMWYQVRAAIHRSQTGKGNVWNGLVREMRESVGTEKNQVGDKWSPTHASQWMTREWPLQLITYPVSLYRINLKLHWKKDFTNVGLLDNFWVLNIGSDWFSCCVSVSWLLPLKKKSNVQIFRFFSF